MSVLIKGGRVITAADDYVADIFIEGERISLIGESLDLAADKVIDASGKYVLPGAVDPHTHLEMPWRRRDDDRRLRVGSHGRRLRRNDHARRLLHPGQRSDLRRGPRDLARKREGKALIDNGFHIAVTDLHEGGTLEELARLPEEHGVTSYKLFMAYKDSLMVDDETLFKVMQVAAETGALVMVHAENGDAIEVLDGRGRRGGKHTPRYHALTRPPELEGEATNRAIQLARVAGSPLYVVHVSCKESAEPIALARDKGWDVWGETCTQYFFIDQSFLDRPDFEGAKYVYTPPPSTEGQSGDSLECACGRTSSRRSRPTTARICSRARRTPGSDDFRQIPNGGPGLENRLHMIHQFGVRAGHISLNRMVELLCTNPAKLFGLYPRKGTLAVGSDADVVVFDPEKKLTISAATHHSRSDYNLYEGTEVQGSPEVVLIRGHVVVENDALVAEPGSGQFVKRAKFGEELKPADALAR